MRYLCGMNRLSALGGVPVSASVVASFYPDIKAANKKVAQLEHEGSLIRLKRGLYVVSPQISGCRLSTCLMANEIYAPSYVSMHSALRHWGLIPEAVVAMQSMTTKHSRCFENPFGRFEYVRVDREVFPIGVTQSVECGVRFFIASAEKALCDLVASTAGLSLRYRTDAVRFLEEDLRFDMDYLPKMQRSVLEQYVRVGKKAESIGAILKLLG